MKIFKGKQNKRITNILSRVTNNKYEYLCKVEIEGRKTQYCWNDRFTSNDIVMFNNITRIKEMISDFKDIETGKYIKDNELVILKLKYDKVNIYNHNILDFNGPKAKYWEYCISDRPTMYHKALNEYNKLILTNKKVGLTCLNWLGFHFIDKNGRYCILTSNGDIKVDMKEKVYNTGDSDWVIVTMSENTISILQDNDLI